MNKAFKVALGEYGVRETPGSKHNPRVVEYFAKVGHSWVKDDETAWCAAFVGFCLETAGINSTKKLNARSYMDWSVPSITLQLGDIIVFWRGSKSGWQGHVGFYIGETDTGILTLGGNQSDQVFIATYPKNQLLGYRKVPTEISADCKLSNFTLIELINEVIVRLPKQQ